MFGRAIDFKLTREVRQGCPLSPFLFVFLAEIMAENVRKTKEIRGLRPAPRNYHPTSSGAFWPRPLKYSRNRGIFCHGTNDEMAFSEVVSRIWRPCLFSAIRNRYSNKSKTFHRVCVLKFWRTFVATLAALARGFSGCHFKRGEGPGDEVDYHLAGK